MPFGDGTGPRGMGPMTGRGAGFCSGFNQPGFANMAVGRGRAGFGSGWGRPYGYPAWGANTAFYRGRGRGFGGRRFSRYPYPW